MLVEHKAATFVFLVWTVVCGGMTITLPEGGVGWAGFWLADWCDQKVNRALSQAQIMDVQSETHCLVVL